MLTIIIDQRAQQAYRPGTSASYGLGEAGSPAVPSPSAIPSKFAGMQVSADGLSDAEKEVGSAKRRKTAALDCSSTDDDDEITISVRAALTGEMLQPVRVNSTILGGELVDLLARQHRQDRVGTCRLLHGKMQIQRSRSLTCQGITDGSEISFV